MVRRNYFVKRWILSALATETRPVSARRVLDIIKEQRNPRINPNARQSPNLSAVKLGQVMCRMKEVKVIKGPRTNVTNLYYLDKGLYGEGKRDIYDIKQ
tara:strand:- start:2752 stop:3048 length:297 start_codon:yes stop_codon:yes gene_type:complete